MHVKVICDTKIYFQNFTEITETMLYQWNKIFYYKKSLMPTSFPFEILKITLEKHFKELNLHDFQIIIT